MFIEMALDTLEARDHALVAGELREFHCFGEAREAKLLACLEGASPMAAGYLLGLETARALLVTNQKAARAGVMI